MLLPVGNLLFARSHHLRLDDFAPPGSDPAVLEGIRELSLRRERSCVIYDDADPDRWAASLQEYVALLRQLSEARRKLSVDGDPKAKFPGFQWTSPLSGQPSAYGTVLKSLKGEEALVLLLWAAALQAQAQGKAEQLLIQSTTEGGGATQAEAHAAVSELFRRATGILQHAREKIIPAAAKDERAASTSAALCLELESEAVEALELICLGQAQATAAHRAEAKGSSPALLAALHGGARDLFESAAAKLRAAGEAAKRPASKRLRRFVAVSAALHEALALQSLARHFQQDLELGNATAAAAAAVARLRHCLVVAEGEAEWSAALQRHLEAVQADYERMNADRKGAYMQRLPPVPPALPAGRVIAVSVPFSEPPAPLQGYFDCFLD
jgi:hypothetical protein